MATVLPPAPLNRPRTLVVGTAFITSAVLMFFGCLFAIYFSIRSDTMAWGMEWFPENAISLVPGGMNMATLTVSVATMAWAVYAVKNDDLVHAFLALILSALMGIAMINLTIFYYMDIALPIDHSEAALLLYVITGAHLVMVGVGVFWLGLLLLRAFGGQDTSRHRDLVSAASLYWYAMVFIYTFIWLFIYIGK